MLDDTTQDLHVQIQIVLNVPSERLDGSLITIMTFRSGTRLVQLEHEYIQMSDM